jgi:sulfoxide reductase heme-binding subunit YedZ
MTKQTSQLLSIFSLILLCALPGVLLSWQLFNNQLVANPVEALEHATGDWAIYFLLITLAAPLILKRLKRPSPLPTYLIKRTLGLAAFIYALLHLTAYLVFDVELDFNAFVNDLAERPFILIGMIALLILFPLAITSTQGWQRRLKKHWLTLHKGIYLATALAIIHYALLVKADLTQPIMLLTIFTLVILWKRKNQK